MEPARPEAESIRAQEVVKRIVEAQADEAWELLRETITPPRQTMLPKRTRQTQ
jgi:hypothetical protein